MSMYINYSTLILIQICFKNYNSKPWERQKQNGYTTSETSKLIYVHDLILNLFTEVIISTIFFTIPFSGWRFLISNGE